MENQKVALFARLCQLIASMLLALFFITPAGQSANAQMKSSTADLMKKAMAYYQSARYDDAISALTKLATDTTVSKKERKDVFLYLGRAYTAKNLHDKAKWAMAQLLDLEPPLIEPDPDTEPPPLMKAYYDARKDKTGSSEVERPDPGIKTIAILDFKNRSVDDKDKFDPMEKGFSDLLISELNGTINLKVVERERIKWLLDEIGMENDPGKFDMGTAVRVGKLLGVHTILLGSFIKVNDQMKLLSRLVKVETGEILATDEATGDADDFFDIARQLGEKVAKHINVTLSEAETKEGSETKSLDAMLAYSEGLVLVEKGDYKSAYDKFQEAASLDPSYIKAQRKADSIKPLIG
jgi:TolB-like protein